MTTKLEETQETEDISEASSVGSIEEKQVDLDREAKKAAKRKAAQLQEESEIESEDESDEEAERRRRLAGRTDVLGIDGVGLFCLIWVITSGVLFSILYFSVFARDRNFFKPLSQRSTVGKFFHGGIAGVMEL